MPGEETFHSRAWPGPGRVGRGPTPVTRPAPDRTTRRGFPAGTEFPVTQPEGQTARDVFPEDEGIPEVSQDDSPTIGRSEDPEFAPLPRETAGASIDFGTTALEQSEGESLEGRLARELPDDARDVRPSADPERAGLQLDQDADTDLDDDSGTNRTADDVEATGETAAGGQGPEDSAMHVIEGT
jgi:hypothetical protein